MMTVKTKQPPALSICRIVCELKSGRQYKTLDIKGFTVFHHRRNTGDDADLIITVDWDVEVVVGCCIGTGLRSTFHFVVG